MYRGNGKHHKGAGMKRGDQIYISLIDDTYTVDFIKDDNTIDHWVLSKEGLTKAEMLETVTQLANNIYVGWDS